MKICITLYVLLSLIFSTLCCVVNGSELKSKFINLEIDINKEKKLQSEVDNGHQPWRQEPVDVAGAALLEIDNTVDVDNCALTSSTEEESKVKCKGEKTYLVNLKRLVRPFGIWTAVSILIDESAK